MNLLIKNLVKELIIGTKKIINIKELYFDKETEEKLINILLYQLNKPSIEQSKTPTQIVN